MKQRLWLLAAVLLLALAAFLMSRGERGIQAKKPPEVEFPRYARPEEQLRNQRRRTLPPAPAKDDKEEGFRQKRDPVLTALPTTRGKSALIFEASALKRSPVGELWLDCMLSRGDLAQFKRFKDRFGIDPLEDVERFAVSSEKVGILSGDFSGAGFDKLPRKHRAFGVKGMIYEGTDDGQKPFAVWDGNMIIFGQEMSEIEAAINRLEDRAPPAPPVIPEWASYGDVYGVISAEDLAQMLPSSQREIAERLKGALENIELHVDATDDVAIVADATGPAKDEVSDLGKTLGTAISLGRLKAQSDGDDKLAELLEFARISPRDGRFSAELALPVPVIQRQMGPCRKDREGDGGTAGE